jgi:hypothetical protein
MFTAALAALTRFWGGDQNLLFPLQDDLASHELFWALADRLDADHFLVYNGAAADLEYLAPEDYAASLEAVRQQVAEFDEEVIRRHLEEWRELWIVEGQVPDGLEELLVGRVAPMHDRALNGLEPFGGMHAPPYPFTDVASLADLPQPVTDPTTTLGEVERLLLAAEVGRLPPGLRQALADRDIEVADEALDTPVAWRQFYFRHVRRTPTNYPLRLTELGLEWYRRQPLGGAPLPVVVGDDAWDFTLFYALRRWRSLAYWIPAGYLENEEYCRNLLMTLEQQPTGATTIALLSASDDALREQALERLAEYQERMGRGARRLTLQVGDWREFVRDEPNRLFERDNYGLPQPLLVVGGTSPQLPTPLPRQVAAETPTDIRWITDVAVDGWSAVRNRRLGVRVLDGGGYDEHFFRAGNDGLAYHCPHFMTIGGASLEASTVRPRLRPLDLLDQLATAVEPQGWRITPSDKGIYARETTALFGGIAELATALRSADTRPVLDTYLRRDDAAPGRLLVVDSRRYLSLADIGAVLDEERAAARLGELEPLQVLRRGVILKCRRCRAAAFYSAAEFEPTFRCVRCRLDQVPDRSSWFGTIEPIWYYRLDEVVFQFLMHNGHLPLLAAFDRFQDAREPVAYAFELDVFDAAEEKSELDVAVLVGGRLWVGEATVQDRFETSAADEQERLARLGEVVDVLDAYGIIFATSAPEFSERTKTHVDAVFDGLWPRVEYREAVAIEAAAHEVAEHQQAPEP